MPDMPCSCWKELLDEVVRHEAERKNVGMLKALKWKSSASIEFLKKKRRWHLASLRSAAAAQIRYFQSLLLTSLDPAFHFHHTLLLLINWHFSSKQSNFLISEGNIGFWVGFKLLLRSKSAACTISSNLKIFSRSAPAHRSTKQPSSWNIRVTASAFNHIGGLYQIWLFSPKRVDFRLASFDNRLHSDLRQPLGIKNYRRIQIPCHLGF